nr:MAG TPA: hypothetical protein [Caudoviricetes sp.]DAQ28563.1 MAG TPA: hypothetical protein [Caudoviricetes sp.]
MQNSNSLRYSVRNTRAPRLTLWGSLLTRLADQQ